MDKKTKASNSLSPEKIYRKVVAELETVESDQPKDTTPSRYRRRLNSFREVFTENRGIVERFFDSGGSGKESALFLTALSDAFVIHACQSHIDDSSGLALVALGGYGRKELNPGSDIDILCIVPDKMTAAREGEIHGMIQFLWDMHFDVGHSTRSICDCLAAAEEDSDFATSLLDGRFLHGERELWETLQEQYRDCLDGAFGRELARGKLEERKQRLATFHNTVQIQEPNIKECPGALRDLHVIRWLAVLTGSGALETFIDKGFITAAEAGQLEQDIDFFLRIRNALHFLTGRKSDVLDHLVLPEVAVKAGYRGKGNLPVESLMHDYYMCAGRVKRICDRIASNAGEEVDGAVSCDFVYAGDGIMISDTEAGIQGVDRERFMLEPALLIRLCRVAGERGLSLTAEMSARIEDFIETAPDSLFLSEEVQEAFRELFNAKNGIAATLRLMHAHGILTRIVPEFDEISWHYQFDFYHTYTTDEHSIRVVENLEKLVNGGDSSLDWLTEIADEITAKAALYLAGFFHDIGKKTGRGHAKEGEKMTARALKRLNFDSRTVKLVRFLVAEHLVMSHISQRRDIDDEDTVRDFIEKVGSTGRLRLLTLITFADLMALSESAMTDWKKSLLRSLFNKGLMMIEKGFEAHAAASLKQRWDAVAGSGKNGLSRELIAAHLDLLPEQYLRVSDAGTVRSHIAGVEKMRKRGAWASFRSGRDYSLLSVITADYSRALSDICGTITASGINIIGARIFTRDDGVIIDTFLVTGRDGEPVIRPEIQRDFKRNLIEVVVNGTDVAGLISDYHRRWRRVKKAVVYSPPRVRIHNDISSNYTVVDIFAIDYAGLLYDITSVFASLDIDIHTAKIGTDEDQVADAFYIKSSGGGKIADSAVLDKMRRLIIKRLSGAVSERM